jgi:hypothetical protein
LTNNLGPRIPLLAKEGWLRDQENIRSIRSQDKFRNAF